MVTASVFYHADTPRRRTNGPQGGLHGGGTQLGLPDVVITGGCTSRSTLSRYSRSTRETGKLYWGIGPNNQQLLQPGANCVAERTLRAPTPPRGRRLPPPRNRHTAPGNTRRQSQRVSEDGSTSRSKKRPLTRQNTWSGASSTTAGRRAGLYAGFCTPGPRGRRGDGHPSRTGVAAGLVRSTRGLGRAALERPRRSTGALPLDLAPGGVYLAAQVTLGTGGLLHHRFTLTEGRGPRRSVFCGTVPRVTPGGR